MIHGLVNTICTTCRSIHYLLNNLLFPMLARRSVQIIDLVASLTVWTLMSPYSNDRTAPLVILPFVQVSRGNDICWSRAPIIYYSFSAFLAWESSEQHLSLAGMVWVDCDIHCAIAEASRHPQLRYAATKMKRGFLFLIVASLILKPCFYLPQLHRRSIFAWKCVAKF